MKYISVCSGIEAATCAWHSLGWQPVAFSEIEKFPSLVLKHHYSTVPNLGDMTQFQTWPNYAIDLLVGGTPCQSFSVAGLRKGLDDPRGNLMLTFGAIAGRYRPEWLVWENVPGVLSSNGGRDFGTFLGMLAELGYGFAYRVLDAQYFGVPQRRRRVFVVANLRNWRRSAAVLFERQSLRWDSAPSREAREEVAGTLGARTCLSKGVQDAESGHLIAPTLDASFARLQGQDNQHINGGAGLFVVHGTQDPCVGEKAFALGRNNGAENILNGVRRLTPLECERLQGFPDNYTDLIFSKDGPRYKAIGNSMAVPVMRWIGERIQQVSEL